MNSLAGTSITIDIQASNKLKILDCVRDSIEYMPGWEIDPNVCFTNNARRFFVFDLNSKRFSWLRFNDILPDVIDGDMIVSNIADISSLLEFVWINGEQLKQEFPKPEPKPVPVVPHKNSIIYYSKSPDDYYGYKKWDEEYKYKMWCDEYKYKYVHTDSGWGYSSYWITT